MESTPSPRAEAVAWQAFASAKSAEELSRAWLAVLARRLPALRAAAILIEVPESGHYVPIAVWPEAHPDLGRLSGIAEDALREGRGVTRRPPDAGSGYHLAYPQHLEDRVAAVVALEIAGEASDADAAMREIHWGAAWLTTMLSVRRLAETRLARDRYAGVLEAVATALRHGKTRQALLEVANSLRGRFDCARVAIGLAKSARIRMEALSEAASFEKHAFLVKTYEQAMEEAYDEGRAVELPAKPDAPAMPRHEALLAATDSLAILSVPLMHAGECIGMLTLDKTAGRFGQDERDWLDAFAALFAPILIQRRDAEQGALRRLGRTLRRGLELTFGPRHLTWKTALVALCACVATLFWLDIDYRVSARTVIEGEIRRVVAAPFSGFLAEAFVRAGDSVVTGQPLARLDDRELRLEQAKWSSERDQYDNKLREAMATGEMAAIQILGAQRRQSVAQLALVSEKIARSRLSAPFDGIVVSGDLSQEIGAPVELGKPLFEIAPLERYRIILRVDERDIRQVAVGQRGRLLITGIAGEPLDFEVIKVTPVATAADGRNFFRVEASLDAASPRLRPGMEGVGKIEIGRRSLWWVLTHGLAEWLTLSMWSWLP